jgi:hypothetical protein
MAMIAGIWTIRGYGHWAVEVARNALLRIHAAAAVTSRRALSLLSTLMEVRFR